MTISVEDIKKLREQTGAGMMDAKHALTEAGGNMDEAVKQLRIKGQASAAKRATRETGNGVVASYVHSDRIGVLVAAHCETDFVARTDEFKGFARDVAMHIAAMAPLYNDPESVPEDVLASERDIYSTDLGNKPDDIKSKIIAGKLEKYYESVCLSHQPFVKDPDKTIDQLTTELAAKVGENVRIGRFSRVEI